jgi:hypothetical protein
MDTVEIGKINELVSTLRSQRDWVNEVNNLATLIEKLDSIGKVTSTRELSKLLDKSKSWIAISLILAKGLKTYPEIEKFSNRNKAYLFLQRKQKLRRFLES